MIYISMATSSGEQWAIPKKAMRYNLPNMSWGLSPGRQAYLMKTTVLQASFETLCTSITIPVTIGVLLEALDGMSFIQIVFRMQYFYF